jgi:small subunit ribosomal protein S16
VGVYDPTRTPELIRLKQDRVDYWLSKGARPSETVAKVLARARKAVPAPEKERKPAP